MLAICLSMIDSPDDKDSFEQIYLKYRQDMFALAYSILHNKEDAEDAVHYSFLKIAENFTKISQLPCNEIKAYIVIIVKNTSINLYNKNKRSAERNEVFNEELVADDSYYTKCDYDSLVCAIKRLPQIYKDVLYLYYIQGFSLRQTAYQLEINESTARQRAKRAKTLIKKYLEEDDCFGK